MKACSLVTLVAAAGLLGACVTLKRPEYQPVTSHVVRASGFRIDRPSAIVDPKGLRFHGWICRESLGIFAPRRLRIERLDATGQVIASATGGVMVPNRYDCTIYDIATDWRLPAGAPVRLCRDDGAACPVGGADVGR